MSEMLDVRLNFEQNNDVYFHTHVGTFDNGMEVSLRYNGTVYTVTLNGSSIKVDILPVLERAALILKEASPEVRSEKNGN